MNIKKVIKMDKQEIIPLNLNIEDFIFKITEKTTLQREDVIHWLLNEIYLGRVVIEDLVVNNLVDFEFYKYNK